MSSTFAASNEFTRRYGRLDDRGFVELVYRQVLGRPGDPGGVDYWTAQLESGRLTRGQVMVGFSESDEFVRKQVSEVTAAAVPTLMLGRAPSSEDFASTVAALDAGDLTVTDLVGDILSSPEYADRIDAIG